MTCVDAPATISSLAGDGNELAMAEATTTAISRRSTRIWAGDGEHMETAMHPSLAYDSRYGSSGSDESSDASLDETRAALGNLDRGVIPGGRGIDLNEIFPTNKATMGSQGMLSTYYIQFAGLTQMIVANYSQAARSVCKSTLDGRPINFGAVLPGAVYRSSFPMPENLPFLGTLGLKTILLALPFSLLMHMLMFVSSLVNHDFPPEFKEFLTSNGIRHCIVEMQGTKRVEIPDIVMNSIMEIALNKDNHPLLIHCNHGRVPYTIVLPSDLC